MDQRKDEQTEGGSWQSSPSAVTNGHKFSGFKQRVSYIRVLEGLALRQRVSYIRVLEGLAPRRA